MQRPPRPTLFPYTTLFRSSTRTLLWCRMKRVSVIASGRQEVLSLRAEKFSAVLKPPCLEDRREFFSAQGEDLLSAGRDHRHPLHPAPKQRPRRRSEERRVGKECRSRRALHQSRKQKKKR